MKNKNMFRNANKVANALMAVVAGLLTDLLYDSLEEEYFEGQFTDGAIQIFKFAEHTTLEKICFIVTLFFLLWAFLSYGVPLVVYCVNALRYHNIPKINKEKVLDTYQECKSAILDLRKQVQDITEEKDSISVVIFKDACLLTTRLHKVFCSGKRQNESTIRNSFRESFTVNDIDLKISIYEYLAIMDVIQQTVELSRNKAPDQISKLLDSDCDHILSYLEELKKLPSYLNLVFPTN